MYEITEDTIKPDRSPCLTCKRKERDKSRCAPICKRVDAFRRGYDYADLPIPNKAQIAKSKHLGAEVFLCTTCEKHPASPGEELCRWCKQALKRKASKK